MFQKICLIGICSLILISAGCSEHKRHPSWTEGDECSVADMKHINGAECAGRTLISCRQGMITVETCEFSCDVKNDQAYCVGEAPINNNPTNPTTPSRPGNDRPGNNPNQNEVTIPNPGDSCGDIAPKGVCSTKDKKIAYCGKNNVIAVDDCANGCLYDKDGFAICITPCGSVTASGVCNENTLNYCDTINNIETLIIYDCGNDICQETTDDQGKSRYDCVKPSVPSTTCGGGIDNKGQCFDEHTVKWCDEQGNLRISKCQNTKCEVNKDGFAGCANQFSCGDIDIHGICDGENTLKYCNDTNELIVTECANGCVKPNNADADCYKPCGNVTNDGLCENHRYLSYCDDDYGLIKKDCGEQRCVNNGSYFECQ